MIIDAELKDWGNSYGIRIPKKVAKQLKAGSGDHVVVEIKRIVRTFDGFGIFKGSKPFVRDHDDFRF